MGIFTNQLLQRIEWNESNPEILMYRHPQREIRKDSLLVLKPGQDAVFLSNGSIEGIFTEDGSYDIGTQIVPFLSTLKSWKFGFNRPMTAEVIFINNKEVPVKFGTPSEILLPTNNPNMPGGLPIRCHGQMVIKIIDIPTLLEKTTGITNIITIEEIKKRLNSLLQQTLIEAITSNGIDILQLQVNVRKISNYMKTNLDYDFNKIGLKVIDFTINNFNYPEQIQAMINKVASQAMIGNINNYTQIAMADSLDNPNTMSSTVAQMGMMGQMINQFNQANQANQTNQTQNNNQNKFCTQCGTKLPLDAKFCSSCGGKQ